MKFYGIAFAVVPKKGNPHIYSVTCTPIVMDQANQRSFQILHDLTYTADFDSMNVASTAEAFTSMVRTIETVTKMQEKSCRAARIAYRPVALTIGEHSQHKVKLHSIYTLLFGEKNPIQFAWRDEDPQVLDKQLSAHKEYLESPIPYTFKEACKKAPSLIKKCTFRLGGYVPPSNLDDPALRTPNELDAELKILKPLFERGDPAARNRLIEIATEEGKKFAKEAPWGNALNMSTPRGYASNLQLQEELPRFAFYHWDQAFGDAFQEAYSREHWRKGYLSVKLPLDPLNPFFTDVVADRIRSQFQIVEGTRKPEEYHDHNMLLEKAITPISRFALPGGTSTQSFP